MSPRRGYRPRRRSRGRGAGAGLLVAVLVMGGALLWNALTEASAWAAANRTMAAVLLVLTLAVVGGAGVLAVRHAYVRARQRSDHDRRQLVRARAKLRTLDGLDALNWREFEHEIVSLLRRDGCTQVRHTGGRQDGGVDIMARAPDGTGIAVQCKHYRPEGYIEVSEIRNFDSGARLHGAQRAILVTTAAHIGLQGRQTVERAGIELVLRDRLTRWAQGESLFAILGRRPRRDDWGGATTGGDARGSMSRPAGQRSSRAAREDEGRESTASAESVDHPPQAHQARTPQPPPAIPRGRWQAGAELPDGPAAVELDEQQVARRVGMQVSEVERMIGNEELPARPASSAEQAATRTRWRIPLSVVQDLSHASSQRALRGRRGLWERERDDRER
jgi:restriction system protein